MDNVDRALRNGRAAPARLLALFVILVGLLAMHGLASSHHSAATAAERPAGPAERHAAAAVVNRHSAAAVQAHDVPHAPAHDVPHAPARHVTHAPAHHGAAATGSPAQQPTGPLAAPSGPSCDTDCVTGLVALCVAVVTAAVTAAVTATAVLLRHRARPWGSRPTLGTARAPTAARLDPPPPDPVRELCVSRT